MDESYDTHECVMSHVSTCHVTSPHAPHTHTESERKREREKEREKERKRERERQRAIERESRCVRVRESE